MKPLRFLLLLAVTQVAAGAVEVIIVGSIENPGKYVIDKNEGVLDLVVKAGGIRPEGKALALKREIDGETEVYRVNPSGIIESGRDISLKNGDEVFALSMSFEGLFGQELRKYNLRIIEFTKRDPKHFVDFEALVEQYDADNPVNSPDNLKNQPDD